jgi:hypothetical protein
MLVDWLEPENLEPRKGKESSVAIATLTFTQILVMLDFKFLVRKARLFRT